MTSGAPTVRISSGLLAGLDLGGVVRFAGIPFAAPPVGTRRFAPPEPVDPWDGVHDAMTTGPICPQQPSALDRMLEGERETLSEDCLHLNVWAPGLDGRRRPVMVWIHGGGFTTGSGSSPLYDGTSLARRGDVVVVTINYRLGPLGFLALDSIDPAAAGSGNVGLLDQIAALEWVAANIEAFGGDPDRVTVFGESAGAMSIGALLAVVGERGLFRRAIMQSGSPLHVRSPSEAAAVTRAVMAGLRASTLDDLRAVPSDRLVEVANAVASEGGPVLERIATADDLHPTTMAFQPVLDGVVIDRHPLDAIADGAADRVEILTGTTADEHRLFTFLDTRPIPTERLERRLANLLGDGRLAADHYQRHPHLRRWMGGDSGPVPTNEIHTQVLTDSVFWEPTVRFLETIDRSPGSADAWNYYFDWPTPVAGGVLGSCHGLELPFVFDTIDVPGVSSFVGRHAPHELAVAMQEAWVRFASTGDPNGPAFDGWRPYDREQRPTTALGDTVRAIHDLHGETRTLWASSRTTSRR